MLRRSRRLKANGSQPKPNEAAGIRPVTVSFFSLPLASVRFGGRRDGRNPNLHTPALLEIAGMNVLNLFYMCVNIHI